MWASSRNRKGAAFFLRSTRQCGSSAERARDHRPEFAIPYPPIPDATQGRPPRPSAHHAPTPRQAAVLHTSPIRKALVPATFTHPPPRPPISLGPPAPRVRPEPEATQAIVGRPRPCSRIPTPTSPPPLRAMRSRGNRQVGPHSGRGRKSQRDSEFLSNGLPVRIG